MDQLLVFNTGRAGAAGVNISLLVRAVDELGVGNGKGSFAAVFRSEKQLGMAHPLIQHRLNQFAFYLLVAWYFAEFQLNRLKAFARIKQSIPGLPVTNLIDFPDSPDPNSTPMHFSRYTIAGAAVRRDQ